MSLSKPASREELLEYALIKLGKGAIDINITDEQAQVAIDETLQLYNEYHYDGTFPTYLRYKINPQDKVNASNLVNVYNTTNPSTGQTFSFEDGKVFLVLPDAVLNVDRIWRVQSTYGYNIFNYEYQFFLNDFYNFYGLDIINYYMTKEYIRTLQFLLQGQKNIRFSQVTNRLYIDANWNYLVAGDYLIIQCYVITDPLEYTKVYNERFNKTYLELLLKKQWGANLKKYRGMRLPGDVELNGKEIYDEAVRDIEEFKRRIPYDFSFLPGALIG